MTEPEIMQQATYIRIQETKSIKEQAMTLEKQDAELFLSAVVSAFGLCK